MSHSTDIYPFSLITGLPEYINFQWNFNFFTGFLIISTIYSIPPILIVFVMTWKFVKNQKQFCGKIRFEIFVSFLIMQHVNTIAMVFEFLTLRIPNSGLVTAYCAYRNPTVLLAVINFGLYTSALSKNYVTVVFCLLRVLVMYSTEKKLIRRVFYSIPFLLIFAIILAYNRMSSTHVCVQLNYPFPFGSIMSLTLTDPSDKLREQKKLSSSLNKKYDSKAEKTLSVTMLIILLPIIMTEILLIAEASGVHIFMLVVLRPVFADARAHIVTCYFYWTHPVFQTKIVLRRIETCKESDK